MVTVNRGKRRSDESLAAGTPPFGAVELSRDVHQVRVTKVSSASIQKPVTLSEADFILMLMSVFWEGARPKELNSACA